MNETQSPVLDKKNESDRLTRHSSELIDARELPELRTDQYLCFPLADLERDTSIELCNQLFEPDERFCQGYYRYWRYILKQSKEEAWQNALDECDSSLSSILNSLDDPYMHTVGFQLDNEPFTPAGIFGFRELTQHYQGKKLYQSLEAKNLLDHYDGKLAMAHTYSSLKKYRNLLILKYTFLQIALQALKNDYKHIFFFMSDFRLGTIYTRFGLEFPEHLSFPDSRHLVGCYTLKPEHVNLIYSTAKEFGIDIDAVSDSL